MSAFCWPKDKGTQEERWYHKEHAVLCLAAQPCPTLCDPMNCSPPGTSVHGDSPGKKTEVGCHALLPGIFLPQGLNTGLPHCRQILYQGSPRILERVAYPFSRGSSQPRNRTRVSCIVGGFFTNWDTREAVILKLEEENKNTVILETLGNASPEGQWSLNVLVKVACLCQAFAFFT